MPWRFPQVNHERFTRCRAVKLIFLDEISTVGNIMFNVQIKNRLKDVMSSKEPFGGESIIALADLFRLEPVMDAYVLKDIKISSFCPQPVAGTFYHV